MSHDAELFSAALALPPSERAAFLDRACAGDAALRTQVDALLAAHASAGSFMAAPAQPTIGAAARARPTSDEQAGQMIGRYKILQKIGEGGCGLVFMAEQEQPVRRRVALKIIKLGMDTKEVIARFEAERQALAMMDHPNIAKVLDAGSTDGGRPYFVMELVRGVKVTDYCDRNNLATAARLELFVQICQAVQHAHQKGIIHRDLKPSNILVTLHDGVPVPKVIDFGIAKATQGRLTDATLFTAFEQFIGTPAYMSPEQSEMSGLDIDTRSDVYSLGVLLYELLTGRTPFDAQELLKVGLDEMRRHIRDVEPPRPSTRLSTLNGDALTVTASQRQVDARRLVKLVRGDLDWIVMCCLEKDRTRRYESASGLARDIRHHLANEPVHARPQSAAYRFRKLVVRKKLAVTAITAIALALIAGCVVSTWAYVNERTARSYAIDAAVASKVATEEARGMRIKNADAQRATLLAEKQRAIAEATTKYGDAMIMAVVTSGGATDRLHERFTQLSEQLDTDPEISDEARHRLCERVGDVFAGWQDYAAAERMYRRTVLLRRRLLRDIDPETGAAVKKLIDVLRKQGKEAEAQAAQEEANVGQARFFQSEKGLNALRSEARRLEAEGEFAAAEERLRRVISIAPSAYRGVYWPSADLSEIARIRFAAGDFAAARVLATQAIEIGDERRWWQQAGAVGALAPSPEVSTGSRFRSHTVLGQIALREGDRAGARHHLLQCVRGMLPWTRLTYDEVRLAHELLSDGDVEGVVQFLDRLEGRCRQLVEGRSVLASVITTGFDWAETFGSEADGRIMMATLRHWRQDAAVGRVPAEWVTMRQEAGRQVTAAPRLLGVERVGSRDPKIPKARSLLTAWVPFSLLALGWISTAVAAPWLGTRRVISIPAAVWLFAFCAARTLDVAFAIPRYASGLASGNVLLDLLVPAVSWALLWEFVRALKPELSSRAETWFVRVFWWLLLLGDSAGSVASYVMRGSGVFITSFGLLVITLLTLLVFSVTVCPACARRLWLWRRTRRLDLAQRFALCAALPLLCTHGLTTVLIGAVYESFGRGAALTALWGNALLPWLLAYVLVGPRGKPVVGAGLDLPAAKGAHDGRHAFSGH